MKIEVIESNERDKLTIGIEYIFLLQSRKSRNTNTNSRSVILTLKDISKVELLLSELKHTIIQKKISNKISVINIR